jgi:serine/threonine protein kinase
MRNVVGQILNGYQFLRREEYIHGDLKPENIFIHNPRITNYIQYGEPCSSTTDGYTNSSCKLHQDDCCCYWSVCCPGIIKIGDFGFSQSIGGELNARRIKTSRTTLHEKKNCVKGTPLYMAPEILWCNAESSSATDMWAIGLIGYECLYGKHPFDHCNDLEELQSTMHNFKINTYKKKGNYTINDELWYQATDFIKKCLKLAPKRRPDSENALRHPIFKPIL